MNKDNQEQSNGIPVGAKIISVIYYIAAVLLLIGFILIIINNDIELIRRIFLSIFLLGFAILCFFVGRGLWKGDKGSRITAIIISILGIVVTIIVTIILSILSKQLTPANDVSILGNIQNILIIFDISKFIPKAIINIIISALMAGYLLFNKKVKEAFK